MIKIILDFESKIYNFEPNKRNKTVIVFYDRFSPPTKIDILNVMNLFNEHIGNKQSELNDAFCLIVPRQSSYETDMTDFNVLTGMLDYMKSTTYIKSVAGSALRRIAVYTPQPNKEGLYSIVSSLKDSGYSVQLMFKNRESYCQRYGLKKYRKIKNIITSCNILVHSEEISDKAWFEHARSPFKSKVKLLTCTEFIKPPANYEINAVISGKIDDPESYFTPNVFDMLRERLKSRRSSSTAYNISKGFRSL